MSRHQLFFVLSFLLSLTTIQPIHAVEFSATNRAETTPGGVRFTNEIGLDYTKQQMSSSTNFIWSLFQQTTDSDKKNIQLVSLFIDTFTDQLSAYPAYSANNEIHLNENYINTYSSGDVKTEVTGIIYHEMTHIWQWNGNGVNSQELSNLIEGIADFVRLKAGYAPSHWKQPGDGDRWDQGYDVTARFLDYCEGQRNGFVAELNKKLRDGYSRDFFVELLGKTVDQLWTEYKAAYAN